MEESEDRIYIPSPSTRKAAQAAASNQHALVNLIRLIKFLEVKLAESEEDEYLNIYIVRKDWEVSALIYATQHLALNILQTVLYARVLLDTLKQGNEQSVQMVGAPGHSIDGYYLGLLRLHPHC